MRRSAWAGLAAGGGGLALTLALAAPGGPEAPGGEKVGGGTIIFTKPVLAVLFEHDYHVEEGETDCDACHEEDGLFEKEYGAAQERPDFDMKTMEEEGSYCGQCHDVAKDCTSCHIGRSGLRRYRKAHPDAEIPGYHARKGS